MRFAVCPCRCQPATFRALPKQTPSANAPGDNRAKTSWQGVFCANLHDCTGACLGSVMGLDSGAYDLIIQTEQVAMQSPRGCEHDGEKAVDVKENEPMRQCTGLLSVEAEGFF